MSQKQNSLHINQLDQKISVLKFFPSSIHRVDPYVLELFVRRRKSSETSKSSVCTVIVRKPVVEVQRATQFASIGHDCNHDQLFPSRNVLRLILSFGVCHGLRFALLQSPRKCHDIGRNRLAVQDWSLPKCSGSDFKISKDWKGFL